MVEQKNQNLPSIIYAEVSVRSQSGESLLKTSEIITSKNVERFYSEPQLVNATAEKLRTEGFNVLSEGPISITIAAPPEVYERVFQTNIITQEIPIIKGGVYPTKATFLSVPNAEISDLIDSSASSLTNFVEKEWQLMSLCIIPTQLFLQNPTIGISMYQMISVKV